MATEFDTGDAALTSGGSEVVLNAISPGVADAKLQTWLDFVTMTEGDVIEIRLKEKDRSGGTQRQVGIWTVSHSQASPIWLSEEFTLLHGWDWTLKQTAGTSRTIPYSIRKVTPEAADIQALILSDATPFPGASLTEVRLAKLASLTFTGTNKVDASLRDWLGTAPSALVTGRVDANTQAMGTDVLTSGALATTAVNEIRDAILADSTAFNGADVATLIARLTALRAGYLDNLNVGGLVASSAEATAIQNNTRVVRTVPTVIERPDSGSETRIVELLLYDSVGNMEVPDSAPTLTLTNQSSTDRSSRLSSTTMSLVSTGRYRVTYTADAADALEQLLWVFTVVEGGATRVYGNDTQIVDTTAVDFTTADRTKLNRLDVDLTTARAGYLDNINHAVAAPGDQMALVVNAITAAKIATDALTAAGVSSDVATEINATVLSAIAGLNNISYAQTQTAAAAAITAASLETQALASMRHAVHSDYLRSRRRVLEYSASSSYEVLYASNGTTPERRWPIYRDAAGTLPVRDQSDPIVVRGPEEAHP